MIDAWIIIPKTLLDTLWPDRLNTLLDQAIRGYWKDSGTDEVVNVLATEAELDQFVIDHPSVSAIYGWVQGTGHDVLDTNGPTIPAGVLALMNDHLEYDEFGTVISTTPASYSNPNWGHVFLGQAERIFAGAFTNGFTGGFK